MQSTNVMAPPFCGYAAVILEVSVDKSLDYGIPQPLAGKVKRGSFVEVPVRGHLRKGYVVALCDKPAYHRVLPIAKVLGQEEVVTDELFELALWMSRYYAAPLRHVFRVMLPGSIRKNMQAKEQLFVSRAQTRDALVQLCKDLREKQPQQAAALDVLLQVKKGIFLSELMEKAGVSRSPIDSLAKRGAVALQNVTVDRSPLVGEEYFRTKPKKLNPSQAAALQSIDAAVRGARFETHLLHGVTGSGKTEVYMQAIETALAQDKGALMLVPEISLTGQTIERFKSRFQGEIAILHHRLSDGERHDEWHKIRSGKARIVIGARSAVFSPVRNIGLIIVDEEHEMSYKQSEESPCYHARDVAVMRANMARAVVVLGSATPSLESYYNALTGKYILSELGERADSASMPTVRIVDMKREFERHKGYTSFCELLLDSIKKRIEQKEQVILFLNRRGYHTTQLCRHCGYVVECPHCDVSLTFHLGDNALACHLCGYTLSPPPKCCPECRSEDAMKYKGVGTEQIQRALHAIFPEVKSLRIDADTTRHKGSHERLLREFRSGKADVLIGTQMIAKGLHFPSVTLVGVLNSDASLNIPDFRASETVFQLITQVSGRAGRGTLKGEVVIQTCLPDHPIILQAAAQDYSTFYKEEIAVREVFGYPPFTHLVKYTFTGSAQRATEAFAETFRSHFLQSLPPVYQIHPVIPAGYAKIKDKYRFQFLVRGPSVYFVNQETEKARQRHLPPDGLTLHIDVDPASTFF